ncbi:MAG: hypothetical protein KatS3mg068_0923 [Candidatus Sericytochromatia bacterium]|nr:MAG: hypothetical protein KatS3mg068_0923 [Candidatus Sericytochromatia bacterium]
MVGKSLGSDSPINNARATIDALSKLRTLKDIAYLRGLKPFEIINHVEKQEV